MALSICEIGLIGPFNQLLFNIRGRALPSPPFFFDKARQVQLGPGSAQARQSWWCEGGQGGAVRRGGDQGKAVRVGCGLVREVRRRPRQGSQGRTRSGRAWWKWGSSGQGSQGWARQRSQVMARLCVAGSRRERFGAVRLGAACLCRAVKEWRGEVSQS